MALSTTRRRAVATTLAAGALTLGACSAQPGLTPQPDASFVLEGVHGVERVGQITGAEGPGDTTQHGVGHTDLGSMFEADGKVWFVFGDTFADREPGQTGGGGSHWRSNVLGFTEDEDPSDGITIDGMIVDDLGLATELLPSKKVDGDEMTVIPTHGFEAGGAMYLHWMSVRHWGAPGEWEVNEAGLSTSTDGGRTWRKLDEPRWDGESGFVQISPFHVTEDGVDTLYVWGVTHGRWGGVSLAKVAAADVEDAAAWRYFAGADGDGAPRWSASPDDAELVVDDTVGELSVVWNDHLDRWLMTYLREGTGVVMREGITPWGPWSDTHVVIAADEVPGLYAPYMLPRYTEDGGRVVYFTLSIWDPYNVFWYRAELDRS